MMKGHSPFPVWLIALITMLYFGIGTFALSSHARPMSHHDVGVISPSPTDSLFRAINKQPPGKEKLYQLLHFSVTYGNQQPILALQAATNALELSFTLKDKKATAIAYQSLGILHYNNQRLDNAVNYLQKSKTLFVELQDERAITFTEQTLQRATDKKQDIFKKNKAEESLGRKNDIKLLPPSSNSANTQSKAGTKPRKSKIDIQAEVSQKNTSMESRTESKQDDDMMMDVKDLESPPYAPWGNSLQTGSVYDTIAFHSHDLIRYIEDRGIYKQWTTSEAKTIPPKQNIIEKGDGFPSLQRNDAVKGEQVPQNNQVTTFDKHRDQLLQLADSYEQQGKYEEAYQTLKKDLMWYEEGFRKHLKDSMENVMLKNVLSGNEDRIRSMEKEQVAQKRAFHFQTWLTYLLLGSTFLLIGGIFALWRSHSARKKAMMQLELRSLSNHMNPHFIYNSLNSVNLFIAQRKEKEANKYLSDFSRLMRLSMDNLDRTLIGLEEELLLIDKYLLLEQQRFDHHFSYQIDIAPDVELDTYKIPPLLLQPYVENAIWHGVRYREQGGVIDMILREEQEQLLIELKDNGPGISNSLLAKTKNQLKHRSRAMKNGERRIALVQKLHGIKMTLEIRESEPGMKPYPGTRVCLTIPKTQVEAEATAGDEAFTRVKT
jgi:hypothetical protein